jgi:ribosomal-protein-alanine N-acetyltransferase
MTVDDLTAVAALEALGGDVHWSRAQLAEELGKKIARYFVATVPDQKIVGYVGGWIIVPELQVSNIVIHPEFRCKGIGRQLLETLIAQATIEGCRQSTLEVRRQNAHAQALYRAAGFLETSIREKMYEKPEDDAVLMEKHW